VGREPAPARRQKLLDAESSTSCDSRPHRLAAARVRNGQCHDLPDPLRGREDSLHFLGADLPPSHVNDPIEPAEEVEPSAGVEKTQILRQKTAALQALPCAGSHVTKSYSVAEDADPPDLCPRDPCGVPDSPHGCKKHTHAREGSSHASWARSSSLAAIGGDGPALATPVKVADEQSRSLAKTSGRGLGERRSGGNAEPQSSQRSLRKTCAAEQIEQIGNPGKKEVTVSTQRIPELFR